MTGQPSDLGTVDAGLGGLSGLNGARRARKAMPLDMAALNDLVLSAALRKPESRYTLHLDFAADDATQAREIAAALAGAAGILRFEVRTYSALLSAGGVWCEVETVFCMAGGPGGVFCAEVAGHPGWHAEAGVHGLRWGEGDETG